MPGPGRPFVKGDSRAGRPKGRQNETTVEVRDVAHKLISSPEYVAALNKRLEKGSAGAVEPLLWHYAYGKPVDTTRHEGHDGGPLSLKVVHEHHE